MSIHHCLLCLGSNERYTERLEAARRALTSLFPDATFGKEMLTEAIGDKWLSPFCNQLAVCSTPLPAEEVRNHLKQIERDNGRLPDDKKKGIVKLDIDLLMVDETVLKPDDMKRDFVQRGLMEWRRTCLSPPLGGKF